MKNFTIYLDSNVAEFYENIAKICNKPTEDILADTLIKTIDLFVRKTSESKVKDWQNEETTKEISDSEATDIGKQELP